MDIENVASELAQLSKISMLSKGHLEQAKNLMKKLKNMGMSTQEISQITGGKWSESSVKGYVKGIKSPAENPWQDAVGVISSMGASGLHLSDVQMAVELAQQLGDKDLSLADLAEFVAKIKGDAIDAGSLLQLYQEWKGSGLDTAGVTQALELWQNLEKLGYGWAALTKIAEAAGKYGQPGGVIDAIVQFGNLTEVQYKLQVAKKELKELGTQRQSAEQVLKKMQGEADAAKKPLTAYQEAVKLGFHQKALVALAEASAIYGSPEDVLKAINTFGSYVNLVQKQKDAEAALSKTEVACANLEVKWAHLKGAVDMCQKLVVERKFGLDALETLFSVVSKYGGLLDILKAVESYATVEQLKKHIEQLKKDVKQVEGKLSGLTGSATKAEAEFKATLQQFQLVTAKALEVGAEVGKIEQELAQNEWVRRLVNLINEPASAAYNEHGILVARVAKSLFSWVSTNEKWLSTSYTIKGGLKQLANELEGS